MATRARCCCCERERERARTAEKYRIQTTRDYRGAAGRVEAEADTDARAQRRTPGGGTHAGSDIRILRAETNSRRPGVGGKGETKPACLAVALLLLSYSPYLV